MRAGRRFTESEHEVKKREFEAMWSDVAVQPVSDATIAQAAGFAERHTLRAYDALHLATALATEGDDLAFASWDNDLRRAAGAEGLRLIPPPPGD